MWLRPAWLVASGLAGSSGAGCTSLLGVDGDYEAGQGGGATSSTTTSTGDASVTAATVTGATSSGSGGEGGHGGGGPLPFEPLDACDEEIAVVVAVPTSGYVLQDNARAPRARILDGTLSVAWDSWSQAPGVAVGLLGRDGSILQSTAPAHDATPFDLVPHGIASVSEDGYVVLSGADDVFSDVAGLDQLRDAVPFGTGARFLASKDGAWQRLDVTDLSGEDFIVDATHAVTCEASQVADAALVEHDFEEIVVACTSGALVLPFATDPGLAEVRSIAAARLAGGATFVAVRDGEGIHVERGSVEGALPRVQLDAITPYLGGGVEDLNRVTVAAATGGALIAWSRDPGTGTTVAAAFCPTSGSCCAVELESAIVAEVPLAPELHAQERAAPSLASAPDGSDLTLTYVQSRGPDILPQVVAMRLVIAMP